MRKQLSSFSLCETVHAPGAQHFVERHIVYCDTSSKDFVKLPVGRKVTSSNTFSSNTTVEFFPWSKYLVDALFCSVLFCIYILPDLGVSKPTLTLFSEQFIAGQAPKSQSRKVKSVNARINRLFKTMNTVRCSVMT